jgi:hypothetical protein
MRKLYKSFTALRKNEMDEQKTRGIFENHAVNADSYKAM